MRVLWARGHATVAEVLADLPSPQPAYNTVLTMLRILEQKAHVTHEKQGRAFTYVPRVGPGEARRRALGHVLTRFFEGSPELLVLDLLGRDNPQVDEIERVRKLIADMSDHETKPKARRRR
jgi:predicted transcriptional regulator